MKAIDLVLKTLEKEPPGLSTIRAQTIREAINNLSDLRGDLIKLRSNYHAVVDDCNRLLGEISNLNQTINEAKEAMEYHYAAAITAGIPLDLLSPMTTWLNKIRK